MADDPEPDDDGSGYRQVAFALLAIAALLVAGMVAPPLSGRASDGGGNSKQGGDTVIEALGRLLDFLIDDGGDGDGEPVQPRQPACRISFGERPVPGDEVTVTVTEDGAPVAGAVVWFNDDRIGRTDDDGQVTGRVPYSRNLRVRVEAPSLPSCATTVGRARRLHVVPGVLPVGSSTASAAAGVDASGAGGVGAPAASSVGVPSVAAVAAPPVASFGAAVGIDDETVTVTVAGEVHIEVLGKPYPGETVTVLATVEGVPMRRATVTVDGETVGGTGADGRAEIRIPEGTDTVTVTVSRGDFSGSRTVEVLLLEATLRPSGAVLAPGDGATLVATVAGRPVEGAVVRVDGDVVGTTGPDGRLPLVLPLDPTAKVTVTTPRQTASVSLLGLYWLPLLIATLLVALLAALAHREWGLAGAGAVVGVATALVGVLLVDAYVGPLASRLTAMALLGAAALAVLVRWRDPVADAGQRGLGLLARALAALRNLDEVVVAFARRAVTWLERFGELLAAVRHRAGEWFRSLPRSLPALARRFVRGTRDLFARATRAVRRSFTATRAAVAVAAALALAGADAYADLPGVAAVAVALALAGVGWLVTQRDSGGRPDDSTGTTDDASGAPGTAADATRDPGTRSLRRLWRAFAAWVVPGRWRTRTPAEVAREAVAAGYPEGPVRVLTATFRAVEYGERPLTDAASERARDAFDVLETHRESESASATSGAASGESETASEEPTGSSTDQGRGSQ